MNHAVKSTKTLTEKETQVGEKSVDDRHETKPGDKAADLKDSSQRGLHASTQKLTSGHQKIQKQVAAMKEASLVK